MLSDWWNSKFCCVVMSSGKTNPIIFFKAVAEEHSFSHGQTKVFGNCSYWKTIRLGHIVEMIAKTVWSHLDLHCPQRHFEPFLASSHIWNCKC